MNDPDLPQRKHNPAFGTGIFRRRLRLSAGPGVAVAALEDTNHAMRVELQHDGAQITSIRSQVSRSPLTTCPGAEAPLQAFVGRPLEPYPGRPSAVASPRANCTHLHHLGLLARAHALRGGTRQYDIEIPDEGSAPVWSSLRQDGVEIIRWQTWNWQIVAPEALGGLPLKEGFARWAAQRFEGEALEAAFVLQNGYFVSYARRWDTEAWAGKPAVSHESMLGRCYGYQPEVVVHGSYRAGSTLDTTDPATPLLDDWR
jgi:hypothetical protein